MNEEPVAAPGPAASLLLDDQLCFALYAAQRAVTAAYRPLLDELGLTYPQYLALLVLWERGEIPVKELGTALRLDYGTVSPLLKRLESAGLVRRQRSASDERSVRVVLTEHGEGLRARAACVPESLLVSTGMGAKDIARLRGELHRLAARASASASGPASASGKAPGPGPASASGTPGPGPASASGSASAPQRG
ncbi:MarR family winged helix-turn-helix transcriptional regulator [Streptomyces sp. NPDC059909]|uniref:MarR family winged helix-turn-helix transcriptional regulator n=1 Tax=Streptomyces sp. NPDC059909 TaxID=3346998 RepID=UPI00366A2174